MAIVTTTSAPTGLKQIWESPASVAGDRTGIPLGVLRFDDTFAVPAKGSGDETVVNMRCSLPTGFVYRPWLSWFASTAADEAVWRAFDTAMRCVITQSNEILSITPVNNQIVGVSSSTDMPNVSNGTTDNDQYFSLDESLMKVVINAEEATSQLLVTWEDITSSATGSCDIQWSVEFLIYTVEAYNSWKIQTPIPVI